MTLNLKKIPIITITDLRTTQTEIGDKFKIVIRYFFEDIEGYLSNINSAIENNLIEQIIPPTHTIKSSSRIIAATRISEVAKHLELLAQAPIPNIEEIKLYFEQLKTEIVLAKQEFIKLELL